MSESEEYAVVKKKVRPPFTMIDNDIIHDKRMNWKALGLYLYIISLPPNYKLMMRGLGSAKLDGMDSTRAGIKKLEELGYLIITRNRDSKGRFLKYQNWEVIEKLSGINVPDPQLDFPDMDNPIMENPALEKPPLYNTEVIQDYINTTTTTNFKDFKYINMLTEAEKLAINKAMHKTIDPDKELLLLELEGGLKMKKVRNALSFLLNLIAAKKNGTFQFSAGIKVLADREKNEKLKLQNEIASIDKLKVTPESVSKSREYLADFARRAKHQINKSTF